MKILDIYDKDDINSEKISITPLPLHKLSSTGKPKGSKETNRI